MIFDQRLVRVMGYLYGSLYEGRDTVVCYSYDDESPYEPSISTIMQLRQVWIKYTHRDWMTGCEEVTFRVK